MSVFHSLCQIKWWSAVKVAAREVAAFLGVSSIAGWGTQTFGDGNFEDLGHSRTQWTVALFFGLHLDQVLQLKRFHTRSGAAYKLFNEV